MTVIAAKHGHACSARDGTATEDARIASAKRRSVACTRNVRRKQGELIPEAVGTSSDGVEASLTAAATELYCGLRASASSAFRCRAWHCEQGSRVSQSRRAAELTWAV